MRLAHLSSSLPLFLDLPIPQRAEPQIVLKPRNRMHFEKPVQLELRLEYVEACLDFLSKVENIPEPVISSNDAAHCDAKIDLMKDVAWTRDEIISLHEILLEQSLAGVLCKNKKAAADALSWVFGDDNPSIPFSFFNCCRILTSVYGQYFDHEAIRAKVLAYIKNGSITTH